MSRRENSGVQTGLLAGLIGVGIGVIGGIIGSQLLKEDEKPKARVEEFQLPPKKRRTIFPGDEKKKEVEHSPSFEETLECPISQCTPLLIPEIM